MSSLTDDRSRGRSRVPGRPGASLRWFPAHIAVALVTFAVVCGTLVAVIAAELLQLPDIALAAGLGTMGAVGACAAAISGFFVLRRTRAGHDYALIEAASPTHPLVKRLMIEAPGTYVHSLAVANLAEAAAEAVGADPLVTRVGAYYHDAGKLSRPCYFYENQEEGENPHASSTPVASAEIIKAHVTDGVRLAEQYRLPLPVREIVRQHHGTSVVRYFYHKAYQQDAGVYEADFRYPGVVPTSPEAALVMLADASEASVRAMGHPDVDRIEESVRAVIEARRADGQLADSGLTAGDLERVVSVFVRQLVGICHIRIAYPSD